MPPVLLFLASAFRLPDVLAPFRLLSIAPVRAQSLVHREVQDYTSFLAFVKGHLDFVLETANRLFPVTISFGQRDAILPALPPFVKGLRNIQSRSLEGTKTSPDQLPASRLSLFRNKSRDKEYDQSDRADPNKSISHDRAVRSQVVNSWNLYQWLGRAGARQCSREGRGSGPGWTGRPSR